LAAATPRRTWPACRRSAGDHATARRFGGPYLDCALPGLMCNGVEVRIEAEARAANGE
jgi:hypothetical protein